MKRVFVLMASLLVLAARAAEPEVLPLWPGDAPIGDGQTEKANAKVTVYRPEKPNGTAVVICPGGAYWVLVSGPEGHDIAKWLNMQGITGVVLEYRLPVGRPKVPLLDAQRALRLTRAKAQTWGLQTDRIGIMGFSAGGHLASTAGTHFDAGDPQAPDPIARVSCRPDFMILIYPVITMGAKTHGGSKASLLGKAPQPELVDWFSNEKQVTDQTPPAFLAHAQDDTLVVPDNSRDFYKALQARQVPAEYLELPSGGHGLNGYKGPMWDAWQTQSLAWLRKIGRLDAASSAPVPKSAQVQPLFDYPVRDTCVGLVDGVYYLTGTTGHPGWWKTNEGVRIWKSTDLKDWQPLGLVWSIEKDGTWQKPVKDGNRAIWAPELHYFKKTFWITYCVNWPGGATGILKSTSGRAEGPYVDVKTDGPLTDCIDASLFVDGDGTPYFVYQSGLIARLKDDMTGLAETPHKLVPEGRSEVGFEGAFIFKAAGRYYLSCADFTDGLYHCYLASSDKLMGPYSQRWLAIPHGGHNMFFKDKAGQWWSTFFGNDARALFTERPAILPVEIPADGRIRTAVRTAKP